MNIYRKIYEQNFGPIPKEPNGRTYEIHHIDGNHANNDPSNLKAVPIQEHYNIHYSQGDWGACFKIAKRMELPPKVKAELARLSSIKRVVDGTHNFLNKEFHSIHSKVNQRNRVNAGTHNFLGGSTQKKLVENGTHHFLKHNRKESIGITPERAREVQKQLVDSGTHTGTKMFKQIHKCPQCGKEGKGLIMFRFHFDNCKI